MRKINTQEKIGIIFLIIGVVLFVFKNIFEIEFLTSISNYGKFIFMIGAAILGLGYFQRIKKK